MFKGLYSTILILLPTIPYPLPFSFLSNSLILPASPSILLLASSNPLLNSSTSLSALQAAFSLSIAASLRCSLEPRTRSCSLSLSYSLCCSSLSSSFQFGRRTGSPVGLCAFFSVSISVCPLLVRHFAASPFLRTIYVSPPLSLSPLYHPPSPYACLPLPHFTSS
jgi:hypothetical protein